ncbi:MAG: hypothetical protein AAGJ18_30465 [Bacteroidota bacterium]
MRTILTKEKWPLLFGFLLVIFCVVHSKTIVKISQICTSPATAATQPTHLEHLERLTCLTDTSWEEFRTVARPLLPRLISDFELNFVYHYLQRPMEKDTVSMTREEQLKILLIFMATDDFRKKVRAR